MLLRPLPFFLDSRWWKKRREEEAAVAVTATAAAAAASAKKAMKMEAYVSPTMGDVKERKAGFEEKVSMDSTASSLKGKKVCEGCSLRKKENSEHASNPVHQKLNLIYIPKEVEECWSCGVKTTQEAANGKKDAQEAANGKKDAQEATNGKKAAQVTAK
ncbi:hypothetical protein SLEP1_g42497 [Rubroshorea leprosula]|uniref:Uncharacterized protein n=1 Tax=Rubroshorea leprosula TaxID=152421 RepID=A0AAV5LA02_9ROSI|nr:hypothetical protein SLEP1_g42497 [Rubroshorea leprosula]